MERVNRRVTKRWGERAGDLSELGAVWNGFSLVEAGKLGEAVEKVGQAVDQEYLATAALVSLSFLTDEDKSIYWLVSCSAAVMGEAYHRAPEHLHSIRYSHPSPTLLPSSKACPIRASPRSARDAKGYARTT